MWCLTTPSRPRAPSVASPMPRVSTPVTWDEVPDVHPNDFTVKTVPERYARIGDLDADIDDPVFAVARLHAWAERDERAGVKAPTAE